MLSFLHNHDVYFLSIVLYMDNNNITFLQIIFNEYLLILSILECLNIHVLDSRILPNPFILVWEINFLPLILHSFFLYLLHVHEMSFSSIYSWYFYFSHFFYDSGAHLFFASNSNNFQQYYTSLVSIVYFLENIWRTCGDTYRKHNIL